MLVGRNVSVMVAVGDNPSDDDFIELGATRGLEGWDSIPPAKSPHWFNVNWEPSTVVVTRKCGLVQECEAVLNQEDSTRVGGLSFDLTPVRSWRYLKTKGKQPRKIKVIMEKSND